MRIIFYRGLIIGTIAYTKLILLYYFDNLGESKIILGCGLV